jgi:antitoxin Phd
MTVYTYSQARQKLARLLEQALKEGEVIIQRKDGSTFSLKPDIADRSPLDVETVKTQVTTKDIVASIRELRERER